MFSLLYVDDEPGLLEIGKLFLERDGRFNVRTVTSATEALGILKDEQFDAIISDYQMPVMDGIEFLKRVRESGNTIPFIIFTGRGREEIVIQALNEGADFYIQKGGEPVSQFAELGHKVRKAILERRAEASIREHERREADIINFLPDATFAIDMNGVVIAWNRAMEAMTGMKAADILGKGEYEYAIPFYKRRRPILIDLVLDDNPATAAQYPYIRREGKTLFSEIAIPHFNDGRGATLWFTASPLYDTRGKIVGAIESIREITERRRAESALDESEKRFRELADLLPQVVYEADVNGTLVYANHIAFELFGYAEDEMQKGFSVMDMIVPEDRPRVSRVVSQMIARKVRIEGSEEYTAKRKDGSTFPVSIYSSPVIRDGKVAGFRGIIIDITERRRAEERVRESEQNYRLLFENATEGILVAQGDRLVHVNPTLVSLLGRTAEEIMSRPFVDFIHPDDRKKVMASHLQRMQGGTPETGYVFRIFTGDGRERWVEINSTRITWSGEPASLSFLNDITERKKAEDRLVAASNEYESLLSQIQDVYYRSDTNGRLVTASRSWATLLGYGDISECLGKRIAEDFYMNPADRATFLERVYREGKVTDYEVLLRKKDGTPVLVATNSHLSFDPAGTITGIEGTFRDITGKKKTEEALHRSEQRYRNIIEDQTEFISRFRPDGTHVFVNEAYCRYFGMNREDLLGHRFRPEIPPEDRERVAAFFASLTPDNPVGTIEHRIVMHDGTVRWQRWSDRAIFDDAGSVLEYQSVGRDITATKEMEEALRSSEERFRGVVEQSSDLIFILDREMRPVFVSPSVRAILGYGPEELVGKPSEFANETIFSESGPAFADAIQRNLKSRAVENLELRLKRKDGGSVCVLLHAVPVIKDGNVAGMQVTMQDITAKKTADALVREKAAKDRVVLDNIPDLIIVHRDGIIRYVNPAMVNTLEIQPEEVLGRPLIDYIAPEYHARVAAAMRKRLEGSDPVEPYEIDLISGTGGRRTVIVRGSMIEFEGSPAILNVLTDVTERRAFEAAFQKSEERYRSLSESSQDLIFVIDRNDRVTYVNTAAARMLGRPAAKIIGMERRSIFPPDVAEGQLKALRKVFATGSAFRSSGTLQFGERQLWFDHSLSPIHNSSGEVVEVLGISRDITEQKKTEEELRRRTEELDYRNRVVSTLLDTVRIGIFMVEAPSGKPIVANREATVLLGRGILPDASEESLAEVYEAYKAGTGERYPTKEMPIVCGMYGESRHVDDMVVVRPDGTSVRLEVFGTPVFDSRGRVAASLVCFLDITERKRAEEALMVAQEKYTKAFLSVPDAITVSELDSGQFVEVNDAATTLFGYPQEELIGRSATELGIWPNPEARAAFIGRLSNEGKIRDYEVMERRKSGELFHALINADTLTIGGKTHIIVVFRDITEQKRTEQVIKESSRKIAILSSITRHDVANQIMILKGFIQIARMKSPDPVVSELLTKIDAAGSAIARQIEFTREYQELGMQAPAWFRVSDLIGQQQPPGIRVSCTCDAEIFADPMIGKVFFNLTDNAVRHGGKVTEVSVRCSRVENGLVVSVEDDGVGVPVKEKDKIFQKGYGKNTGFGLFLAREILAITGITISESGISGRGARFDLFVPEGMFRLQPAGHQ